MNYEKDLKIDINKLDEEWLKQPSIFMSYAEKTVKAEDRKRIEKESLEITIAELDHLIREESQKNNEKITEKIVESRILTNENYKIFSGDYRKACYEYDILKAAVESMRQKKDALENLVKLFLAGYFSAPTVNKSEFINNKLNNK